MKERIFDRMTTAVSNQRGFTLVELLVVVAIVVALAAVSVVSVTQFAGKGDEGATAAELDSIQAAVDSMMADLALTAVTANSGIATPAVADFTANPVEGPLVTYLRDNPTSYFYCWDTGGKTVQLTAAGNCPAEPY